MNANKELSKQDRWLAAEYALGVLNQTQMKRAEKLFETNRDFRSEVEGWNNQLSLLLDDVGEKHPPAAVWNKIEKAITPPRAAASQNDGSVGFWKMLTALMSTAAVGCFALLMYTTGGDFAGKEVNGLRADLDNANKDRTRLETELNSKQSEIASLETKFETLSQQSAAAQEQLSDTRAALASAESEATSVNAELAENQQALSNAQAQIATVTSQFEASQQEIAQMRDAIEKSMPLVASLTQSGDAPAFVAQYDPLKQALLIRTSVSDTDEKVPEIWLIPDQGDRKGEVLSLGVMDEAAPDTLKIADDFLPLIGEGGTLAITMEPPGGAPNGVATGPVIALGMLQAL